MKSLYILFIGIFFYIQCPQLFSLSNDSSTYYPLDIDNQWHYSNQFFALTERIIDSTIIQNHIYYGLSNWTGQVSYWLREDSNAMYLLNFNDSTEFILYNFETDIGSTWQIPQGYECSFGTEISLISKSDTIITPVDTFINCYHFRHKPACIDAGIYDTWFIKGVGKVRWIEDNIAGMLQYDLDSLVITSIRNTQEKIFSANTYRLYQNYPNPFNPGTNIEFSIPESEFVTLKIYNILAEEVATLVSEKLAAGKYEYDWDAGSLANGVYLYRIQAGDYVEAKKMVLMK